MRQNTDRYKNSASFSMLRIFLLIVGSSFFLTACGELEKPKTEAFYAQTAPPQKKEFRWSNGKMPKSFDPAQAIAAPETDIVRAIFEGLTDTDSKTLEAIPAVAEKWTASNDHKTWTFTLRKDARWSNEERVTAADFVRSWKRLAAMGEKLTHYKLLDNISGIENLRPDRSAVGDGTKVDLLTAIEKQELPIGDSNTNTTPKLQPSSREKTEDPNAPDGKDEKSPIAAKQSPVVEFGVEAVNETTLKVRLKTGDKDFPSLVAHPIFRPVYGDGSGFEAGKLDSAIVTNGAFRVSSVGPDGITLDRSEHFWGKDKVELERVRLIPNDNAEKALEAYRNGEIDAVTNVDFEPLVLKLLAPYDDFKRKTHSALNLYEFNLDRKPFDDRRVREALSIAIDRVRLTEVEMDGSTSPALNYLPFADDQDKKLTYDKERAKELLIEAGFEDGEDFPVIRLVINRNDVQQRIAKAIVKMWKQALNIDTVIVVKESSEIDTARLTGDFDLLRRGVVLPTSDETAGMMAIFPDRNGSVELSGVAPPANPTNSALADGSSNGSVAVPENSISPDNRKSARLDLIELAEKEPILNKADAFERLPAIPLYFPTSYSLVKPYVQGFEINTLDAPSLKDVKIDNNWQPKKPNGES